MKARLLIVSCLLVVLALCLSFGATAQEQEQKPKSEKFGALAYMPHGAGMAMVGAGALLYAAKIKVLEGNSIELESYGIDAIRLMGVRKL
jgi:hypothetical protein